MKPTALAATILLALLGLTCKKEPPPAVQVPALELVAEDASCTEAWLRIRSLQVPATVQLVQVAPTLQTRQTLRLTSSDTLIVDEGLLPNRTYTYKAQLLEPQSANLIASTPDVQLTTMDTTSHNFTWQIDTLGVTSSVLYDVAIINDTLAYAVGEIYKRDSLGNWDPNAYNAVKWNGRTWELKRIPFVGPCSAVDYPPIRAVWPFSETNILFARGGSIVRYDGTNAVLDCGMNSLLAGSINKIYAASPQDVYLVGNAGTIVHYDGLGWRRIESGTGLPIMDIYGAPDSRAGQYEILCVSADQALPGHSQILAIENTIAREVYTNPLWEPWGIWFIAGRRYITAGDGLWQAYGVRGPWVRNGELPALFKEKVRGQGFNDIVVTGSYWLLGHYNGVSWQTYFPRASGALGGIALKGNLLIAVGFIGNQAAVIRGRR